MTKNEFIQQWMLRRIEIRVTDGLDVNREMTNVTHTIEELEHQFGLDFFEATEIHANVDAAIHWG